MSSAGVAADNSSSRKRAVDVRFSCNICFDVVQEPVVTQCGHLYCWPCLYRWLTPTRGCPVCKAACDITTIVPIYVREDVDDGDRNDNEDDDNTTSNNDLNSSSSTTGMTRRLRFRSHDSEITNVPSRPGPSSPRRTPSVSIVGRPSLSHGLAHSLWHSVSDAPPPVHVQDDDATDFLWRLLLMLGSFVVFCLLIF